MSAEFNLINFVRFPVSILFCNYCERYKQVLFSLIYVTCVQNMKQGTPVFIIRWYELVFLLTFSLSQNRCQVTMKITRGIYEVSSMLLRTIGSESSNMSRGWMTPRNEDEQGKTRAM